MLQSPTLRNLVESTAPPDDAFWSELRRLGAPLIEECADPSKRLVTFVYRADPALRNVVLLCCINRQNLGINQLRRYDRSDLWYLSFELDADLRTRYLFSPNDSLLPLTDDDVFSMRSSLVCVDPLNPNSYTLKAMEDDPDDHADTTYSVLELPGAPSLAHTQLRDNVPQGALTRHRFRSDRLANERSIWVYEPHKTYASQERELLVCFDGWNYTTVIPTPTILDNLIHDRQIAPTAALFIDHDTWEARQRELPCNEDFAAFLAHEVMPWAYQITQVSADPRRTTLLGSSFGGLAACFSALRFPDLFGKVVAQSCSAMWSDNRIIREFETETSEPIQIYLDVGTQEYSHTTQTHSTESLLPFRDALASKGYEVVYNEFNGGHDYNCWAASLSNGLTAFPRSSSGSS